MKAFPTIRFSLSLIALITNCYAVSEVKIDFESGSITRGSPTTQGSWNGWKLEGTPSYSPGFSTGVKRTGNRSMFFKVKNELTWGASERSEIKGPGLDIDNKDTAWFGFSVILSNTEFPVPTGSWFIFCQHWQEGGSNGIDLSPPIAFGVNTSLNCRIGIRGDNRTSGITNSNVQNLTVLDNLFTFQRGVWYDFVYRVKWDPSGTGSLLVKYKKSSSANYTSIVNVSNVKLGYNTGSRTFLKAGIYRGFAQTGPKAGTPNNGNLLHVLYIDTIAQGNSEAYVIR